MEYPDSSKGFIALEADMPKRSLRRRAAEGLRLSISKPISSLFHRQMNPQQQDSSPLQSQPPPPGAAEPSTLAPPTPASLRSVKSLFGSFRSNKHFSTNPDSTIEERLPLNKPKQSSHATPRSLRDKFRRTFSRQDFVRAERSSSPIDIPTIRKDLDPLQQPIPSDFTDESENPLQQRMQNSPGLEYSDRGSPPVSAKPSPRIPQKPALSPMPGTTFPMDDLGARQVPFDQEYDQMTRRRPKSSIELKPKRDPSDPFVDSPTLSSAALTPSLRSSRSRSPHKSNSTLRELYLQTSPSSSSAAQRTAVTRPSEGNDDNGLSDQDTLKEAYLPEIVEDDQSTPASRKSKGSSTSRKLDSESSTTVNYSGTKTKVSRIKSLPNGLPIESEPRLPTYHQEPVKVMRKSVKYVNESIFFGQRSERPMWTHNSVTKFPMADTELHNAFDSSIDCSTDSSDDSVDAKRRLRYLRKSKSSSGESSWLSTTTVDMGDALASGTVDGGPLKRCPNRSKQQASSTQTAPTEESLD